MMHLVRHLLVSKAHPNVINLVPYGAFHALNERQIAIAIGIGIAIERSGSIPIPIAIPIQPQYLQPTHLGQRHRVHS